MHESSSDRQAYSKPPIVAHALDHTPSSRKWRSASLPARGIVRAKTRSRALSFRHRNVSFSEPLEIDAFGHPVHPPTSEAVIPLNRTQASLPTVRPNIMNVRTTSEGSYDGLTLTLPKHNVNEADNYYPRWQVEPGSNRSTTSTISHLTPGLLGMPPMQISSSRPTQASSTSPSTIPYGSEPRRGSTQSDRPSPDFHSMTARPTPSPSTESVSLNPNFQTPAEARRTTQMSSIASNPPMVTNRRTSQFSSVSMGSAGNIQPLPAMQIQTSPSLTAMTPLLTADYETSALASPRTGMPLQDTASNAASSYRTTASRTDGAGSLTSSHSAVTARSQVVPSHTASDADSYKSASTAHTKSVQRRTTNMSDASSMQHYLAASHTHDQVYYVHEPQHAGDATLIALPAEQQSLRSRTSSPAAPVLTSPYAREQPTTSLTSLYTNGTSRSLAGHTHSSGGSETGGVLVHPARLSTYSSSAGQFSEGLAFDEEDEQLLSAVHIATTPSPEPFLTPAQPGGRMRANTPAPITFTTGAATTTTTTTTARSQLSRMTAPELGGEPVRYGEPDLATRLETVVSAPARVRSRSTAPSGGLNALLGRIKSPTADDLPSYTSSELIGTTLDTATGGVLPPGSPRTPIRNTLITSNTSRPSTQISSTSSSPGSVPLPMPGVTSVNTTVSNLHSARTTAQSNFGFARADEQFSLPGGFPASTRPSGTGGGGGASPWDDSLVLHGSLSSSQRQSAVSGGGGVSRGGASGDPLLADAAALEEDLAAVMKRLPASLRYGARETGADLVSTGLLQQLYNRLSRLQAMLKQREVDAQKTSRQLAELKTKVADSEAHETELEAHLMVVTRQLASRDQELLDVEQRLRETERRSIEQAQTIAVQYSSRSEGGAFSTSSSELLALRAALETATAALAKRDEELSLASQKLKQRDYELREADCVLRASEREMASQLQTAAGRLLPGLTATRDLRNESADSADKITGVQQDRIRELESKVTELQAALDATSSSLHATITRGTSLPSWSASHHASEDAASHMSSNFTSSAQSEGIPNPRSGSVMSIDAATVTKALEVELESLTRELQMHQATMDALRADTEAAKQTVEVERQARLELEMLVKRLRETSSKTTTTTTATDVNKESHVNVFVSEKSMVGQKWDSAEAFAQEAKYLLTSEASRLPDDAGNQTAIVAMADMAWGSAGIPVALANQWRKALAQERGERQELSGRLEMATAELATLKTQISRLHNAHSVELTEAAHRVQQLEKQVKDLQARLESALLRLQEMQEEFTVARQNHAATADELSLERDACRRLRLQVSVTQGSIDVLQKALISAREELAQAREQQLADALAAQTLSRQVEELGAEAASRLYAAEDAADRLARAQLERLLELRAHPYMENGLYSFAMVPATPPPNVNPSILEKQLLHDGRTSRRSLHAVLEGPLAELNEATQYQMTQVNAGSGTVSGTLSPLPSSGGASSIATLRRITTASSVSHSAKAPSPATPEQPRDQSARALDLSPEVEWHSGLEVLERHLQLNSLEAPPPSDILPISGLDAPHQYDAVSSRASSLGSGIGSVGKPLSSIASTVGPAGSARSSHTLSAGGGDGTPVIRSPMPSLGGSIPATAASTPAPSIGSGIHGSPTPSLSGATTARQSVASSLPGPYADNTGHTQIDLSPRHTAVSSLGAASAAGGASPRNTSLMFIGGADMPASAPVSPRNTNTWSAGAGSITSAGMVNLDMPPSTPARTTQEGSATASAAPASSLISRGSPADSIRSAASALAAAAVGAGAAAAQADNSRRASLAAQADAAMSAIRRLSEARASRASAASSNDSSASSAVSSRSAASSGSSKVSISGSLSFLPNPTGASPIALSMQLDPTHTTYNSYSIASSRNPSIHAMALPVRPHTHGGARTIPAGSLTVPTYPRTSSMPGAFDPADTATAQHVITPVLGAIKGRQSPIPSIVDAGDALVTQHTTQVPSMVGRLQQSLQGLVDVTGDQVLYTSRFGSGGGYRSSQASQ